MLFLVVACDDKIDSNSVVNPENEIVIIGDAPYELLKSVNFNEMADTALWSWTNNGNLTVDNTSKVGDSTVVYMEAEYDCFRAEIKQGVPIVLQQESAIEFSYLLPRTTFNDIRHGEGLVCSGACKLEIYQGNEILFSEWLSETSVWTNLQFLFRTKKTEEVKIKFILGTRKGFWIDNIKYFQKL